eukprot:g12613.t1
MDSDATRNPVAMDEDAKEADVDWYDKHVDTLDNLEQEEVPQSAGTSPSSAGSSDSSTPPPSNTNTTDSKQAEIELLQAENALLRLALEEAEAKLKAVANTGRSVRPARSGSTSSASREPGNGGVAYAQMRRLLLKDERFLRDTFLPFLDLEDFGRLSGVCQRIKRSTYDLDMIVRCVETGGVTDNTRGLLWLIMVGMDTVEPSSRGVLGVVIHDREESPEEQYDRLHRAMNGTTAVAASSPKSRAHSRQASTTTATASSPRAHSRQASTITAATTAAATAATAAASADDAGDGENCQETTEEAEGERSEHGKGKEQGRTRVGEIPVDDDESMDSNSNSSSSNNNNNNNNNSRSRGNSNDSSIGGEDTGGGTGGRLSGGGSVITDTSVAGDASVGGESVLLWEDSDNGKGTAKSSTSPRVQLRLQAANGGFATASAVATTEEQATAMSAAAAAAEAAEIAAMAKAAAEAAGAAFDAEAAAGIRPLGGRQGAAATAAATEEAQEAVEAAAEAAATAAGLAEAAADAEDASAPAKGKQEGGVGGMAGSTSPQQQQPAAAKSSVVGWASGLFRRAPGASSPRSASASAAAPSSTAATGAGCASTSSPTVSRPSEASQEQRPDANDNSNGRSGARSPAVTVSRRSSAGRLFGGLRYSLANNSTSTSTSNTPPRSALPVDNPSPSNTTNAEPFFGKNSGGKGENGTAIDGDGGGDGDAQEKEDGEPPFERVPGLYAALLMSADAMDANDMTGVRGPKQSCFVDIEKDLQRTLGMTDVAPLRNVLRCTSTFVPDVGYVQGMNFVCRSLLQVYPDEEEAFWVFVGMLQRFRLRELYCPGMPLLRLRFFQLNRLLMWHLPDLHEHFEACGVQTNLFATSWFVTLLSDGGMLPDEEVKVVWDRIFLHSNSPASQWAPMFLFLLELLRRASEALKKESRFSELIQRLVNMPFRDLCRGNGANRTIEEARRRFETSSPMPVQLLLLHDQWVEGGEEEEANSPGHDGEKQLL